MPTHDVIVMGASTGGVEAYKSIFSRMPGDLAARILITLHMKESSYMPQILSRVSPLPALAAKDREKIGTGRIYVSPPGFHLTLNDGRVSLSSGPKENGHRPAINPLFRTAAQFYGPRVVGVLLSGWLDDGVAGLAAIKRAGGIAIVQDPKDAIAPEMPRTAICNVNVDYILPVDQIPSKLIELTRTPARQGRSSRRNSMQNKAKTNPAPFTCPECGGTVWEIGGEKFLQFRCRTGHEFSENSFHDIQRENVENALWNALRMLEENAALCDLLAKRGGKWRPEAQVRKEQAESIRKLLGNKKFGKIFTSDFPAVAEKNRRRTAS